MQIKFYRLKDPFGCFSNFSKHPITVDGIVFKTTEHYFQAHKFLDVKNRQDVVNAPTPREAANIGRDRNRPLRKDWEVVKNGIMYDALVLKVTQHPEILELLIGTGDAQIIEDSPVDSYWGCGADGKGLNMLGKCWMKVRDLYKKI
jgi:N-glycosidase YbiA